MQASKATIWITRIGAVLLVAMAAAHVTLRTRLINDPRVDLGGAEINVVYGVQKIMLDKPLYEDPEQAPFDVMQYTPVYYHLCAVAGKVFVIDPHDTRSLFALSRTLSSIFNLLTCALVFLLCRRLAVDAWLALAAAAITLTLFTAHFYSRTDSLYALLFIASLLAYFRLPGERSSIVACALLSVLCFFTKQTGLLVIIVVVVLFVITKRWKELRSYAIATTIGLSVGFALLLLGASPHVLYANMVQGLANGFGGGLCAELFDVGVFKFHFLWFVMAGSMTLVAFKSKARVPRELGAAVVVALLFGLTTGLKHGSNLNYLFEAYVLVAVAMAHWITISTGRTRELLVLGLFLQGAWFGLHSTRSLQRLVESDEFTTKPALMDMVEDRMVFKEMVNGLKLGEDDHVFITYRGHLELLMNGQGLLPQKDIIEWSTDPLFDYSEFTRMMDDGAVRFIVTDRSLDTLHFLGRSWAPLRLMSQVNKRYVYALEAAH